MLNAAPDWLESLKPIRIPKLEQMSNHSSQRVWHVDIDLTAWPVPVGRTLSGNDTWNGKALAVSTSPELEYSVGEVEVAERLRSAFPDRESYWTAGWNTFPPPPKWRNWTLTPERRQREWWLLDLDRAIRKVEPHLASNNRGRPDIVSWSRGTEDLLCAEYKGPSPSKPSRMDRISIEQDAWFRAAVRLELIEPDQYVVVRWIPSSEDRSSLSQQAEARKLYRSSKSRSSGSATSSMQEQGDVGETNRSEKVAASSPKKGKLHRRTISDTLKKTKNWDAKSHVAGSVTVRVPPLARSLEEFRDEVYQAVVELGYEPTVSLRRDRLGHYVCLHTEETRAQKGLGEHRK